MNEIKLYNRDGANLKLVPCDENLWKFEVDDNHKYILQYMRLGFEKDNKTISFVDPSGGPYLSRGQRLSKKYVINSIIDIDDTIKFHLVELEV